MRKVDIMIARFPGNNQEHPDSVNWVIDTMMRAKKDERVDRVVRWHKADTPIDMVRNLCVEDAQNLNIDYLFMIDNDMTPDTAGGKEFYEVAMDHLYGKVEPSAIAAPYVGGGLHNNIFVFLWRNLNNGPTPHFSLKQYDREHAATMSGVTEVAALPTGLIAYDMRVFDRLVATGKGYFYYEMNDRRTEKQSTEDVTNTRDISMAWYDMPGAGCFCAWDCWATHNKIVPCEKPQPLSPRAVGANLRHAFEIMRSQSVERLVDVGEGGANISDGVNVADLVDSMRVPAGDNGAVSYIGAETIKIAKEKVKNEFPEYTKGRPQPI